MGQNWPNYVAHRIGDNGRQCYIPHTTYFILYTTYYILHTTYYIVIIILIMIIIIIMVMIMIMMIQGQDPTKKSDDDYVVCSI